jgi:hypothetical protein
MYFVENGMLNNPAIIAFCLDIPASGKEKKTHCLRPVKVWPSVVE